LLLLIGSRINPTNSGVDIVGHILRVEIPDAEVRKAGPVTRKGSVTNAAATQPKKRKSAATPVPEPKQKAKADVEPKKPREKKGKAKAAVEEEDDDDDDDEYTDEEEVEDVPARPAAARPVRKRAKVTGSKKED
jgi:hypothetical protein